ncbi:hypothetical protein CAAU_1007 [Caloramator australicus RC3]|uniref:Uncharacterized protein n=1 Tax=Caloramator australicus RC3 TaxID=857293 RepID=I7J4V4_9CLOT|nr:hypothetical protein CAAU_1007 [Caloramator australicus RC3]
MIFVITTPKKGKTLNNMLKSFLSDKPYKIMIVSRYCRLIFIDNPLN